MREHLDDLGLDTRGLPSAPGHSLQVLRVVTPGLPPDAVSVADLIACTGGYVCECAKCAKDRAGLVKAGVRGDPSSPLHLAA